MKTINGYSVYNNWEELLSENDIPPFPTEKAVHPYGLKIIESHGELKWHSADKEDAIQHIAKFKGIKPDEVMESDVECAMHTDGINTYCLRINGYCIHPKQCVPIFGPGGRFVCCVCTTVHHSNE